MVSVKILVTYKNKHKVLKSDIITPIQTGRAIADEIFEEMIGDDTGDNISKDNPKYNELSAQYWAWKNYDKLGNPDYIGFMHYRRHFLFNNEKVRPLERWLPNSSWYLFESVDNEYKEYLNDEDIKNTVKGYDCIIPHIYDYTNYFHKNLVEDFQNLLDQKIEHFHLMIDTVKKLFSDYAETAENIRNGHEKYIANMFIMKKEMFNEYCNFLFSIESEIDKKVNSKYFSENESRFLGFLGEILLTIFIKQKQKEKKYKIKEIDTSFILNTRDDCLQPFYKEKTVCIAASASNEYVPYLSVYLQSILSCISKNNNYDIIIFERSITSENKEKLQKQIKQKNIYLRFVNPSELLKEYDLKFPPHYNLECYFRLAAPLILKNYDKVIFTDVDLIFQEDPAKLFDTDIGTYPLAACKDLMWGTFINNNQWDWAEYAKSVLKIKEPFEYFNTGVMILNVKEFNKNNYSKKLLELVSKTTFRILEQDGLNVYFGTKIKYLDTAWNFPVANIAYRNILGYMPLEFSKKYKQDKKNPYIIHYAGGIKPWLYPNEELAEIWWFYARQTPFYEEIMLRMIQHNTSMAMQISRNIDLSTVKNALNLGRNKLKYWRYKILSKITFGKKRKKYKEKRKKLKALIKQTKQFLKGIK